MSGYMKDPKGNVMDVAMNNAFEYISGGGLPRLSNGAGTPKTVVGMGVPVFTIELPSGTTAVMSIDCILQWDDGVINYTQTCSTCYQYTYQ